MTITGTVSSINAIGPCFISPAGIAFGVDVADFLQLQRAFHGNRERHAAAEIQGVVGLRPYSGAWIWIATSWLRTSPTRGGQFGQGRDQFRFSGRVDCVTRSRANRTAIAGQHRQHGVVKALVEATPISGPASVR